MNTSSNETKLLPSPARPRGSFLWKSAVTPLALALLLLAAGRAAALNAGESFPDVTQFGLEGKLPDLKGKVVLVDFFASWCGPCKESFPAMQELHKKYADKGLVVLAVNLDKKPADMEGFLKKYQADFPVVRDASNKLVSAVKIATMPSSFLIDREGKIRAAHKGYKGEETRKKYIEEIESLLK